MITKKKYFIYLSVLLVFFIAGCSSVMDISEIKNEQYVGEEVTVRGTVENSIKIGELSGFTLVDDKGGSIPVASESIPARGDVVTVSGVLRQNMIIGYYIES